ncbi:hypothetical protein [Leptospira ryugenii]|nr:hypothetical protein [Leptospira ryugenii]
MNRYFLSLVLLSLIFYLNVCKSVSYTYPKYESIHMDEIHFFSVSLLNLPSSTKVKSGDESAIQLELGDNNQTSVEILVNYRSEQIDLLNMIASRRLRSAKIIVRNQRGQVLAKEDLATENISALEFIRQTIELPKNNVLKVGDTISFQLEAIYVDPKIDVACAEGESSCDKFRRLSNETNVQDSIQTWNRKSVPQGKPGETVLIQQPTLIGNGNVVLYQEWKLYSQPTYFRIGGILKDGKSIDEKESEIELPKLTEENREEPEPFIHSTPNSRHEERKILPKKRKRTILLP